MTDATEELGTLETERDAGEGQQGIWKYWMLELTAADKIEEDFRKDGDAIEQRYEAEQAEVKQGPSSNGVVSHNILYSNVETMRPALYDSTPVPDIRRRFRDQDPLGKSVAEMLERAAAHQLEINDMDGIMNEVILDSLLPSRGIARLNYEPTFQTIPEQRIPTGIIDALTGEEEVLIEPERDVIVDEKVNIMHVQWRDVRISPARTWADVRWISFDWYLTDSQAKKMFPGKKVPLDSQTEESFNKDQDFDSVPSVFKRAYVREVWDKKSKKVIFIAPSLKDGPLRVDDNPLKLKDFFPIPKPLYGIKSRKSMVPVPEFKQYASQALELDMITKRIQGLIKALRLRGVYDSTLSEMEKIGSLGDNEYIPIENAQRWADAGGLKNAIHTMPIEEAAKVLSQLYLQRDQIKDTIFEITGLSDILRGVSDPNETLGAQNIKSQFGSLRINSRQREVQRFARDIIGIMVEIIAENFQPQTLQLITQKEISPEMIQVMKSDQMRSYRIDIETDSTIAAQIQDEEENYTKLLHSIGQFIQNVAPMVVQGFVPLEVAVSLLKGGIRRFKMGRSVEDAFENIDVEAAKQQIQQQQQQGQQDPEAEAKAQELQLKTQEVQQKLQLEAQKLQLSQADMQGKQQIEAAKLQLEREKATAELALDREKAGADIQVETQKMQLQKTDKESELNFKRELELGIPKEEFMAEIEGKLAQVLQVITQVSGQQHQALAEAVNKMAEAVEELNKPKQIIRKNGQVVGAKVVDQL
jgi:hypothetical protein